MWVAVGLGLMLLLVVGGGTLRAVLQVFSLPHRGGYAGGGPQLQEVVVDDNGSRHKIALIEVNGIITSAAWDRSGINLVDYIKDQLELAGADSRVRAVLLVVDSPGGEVLASDEISRALREFQQEHEKPVVASFGGLAASGGYYVAAPCRWIVANELTITGSIGVIMQSWNYRGLMDKVGVAPNTFKSGRFKDMLSGSKRPEDVQPEERAMIQSMIDETFARFKQVVREGRGAASKANGDAGRTLAEGWEEYADGRILTGQQAFEHGFVDELGNQEAAVARAIKLAGVPDANVVRYQRLFDLGNLFRLFGESESGSVKIDLGMDFPRLEAGRLYFLSPTLIH